MTHKEKILDRLAKLFALAGNNPNANERAAALLHAQRLMAEHAIAEDEVRDATEKTETRDEIASTDVTCEDGRERRDSFAMLLGCAIADYFRVVCYVTGPRVKFAGYESHRKVAALVYRFAYDAMENGAAKYTSAWKALRDNPPTGSETRRERQSWLNGFIKGVREGFASALNQNPQWLAHTKVPEAVTTYVEEKLKLRSIPTYARINGGGGEAGRAKGREFATAHGGSVRAGISGLLK